MSLVLAMGLPLSSQPATAVPATGPAPAIGSTRVDGPPPVGTEVTAGHTQKTPLAVPDRAPLSSTNDQLRRDYDEPATAQRPARPSTAGRATATTTAACNISDFTGRTGTALVQQIEASTTDCVNTLFSLTGSNAYQAFREAQMTSVAYGLRATGYGLRDNANSYPGNNSTGTAQLVLYLRAGYLMAGQCSALQAGVKARARRAVKARVVP